MYFDKTSIDESDGVIIPETERKKIAEKRLGYQKDLEDQFYVPEADEEREKSLGEVSYADLQELRHKAAHALRKAPGMFAVQVTQSDWFQNKVPASMDIWPTHHPMAYEMAACLKPIINADEPIRIEILQERLQERGAFMMKTMATERTDYPQNLWNILFFLDSGLFMEIEMDSPNGIPDQVLECIKKEEEKLSAEARKVEILASQQARARILQEYDERNILREGNPDDDSDSEDEEERLAEEEKEAKEAKFRLYNIVAYVNDYKIYVRKES